MPGKIERRDHTFHFVGAIDEDSAWHVLNDASKGLVLDFGELVGINSIAIAKLISILTRYGHGKLEYHRCPGPILNALNTIDVMLGPKKDPSVVKSFFADYACPTCLKTHSLLIKTLEIHRSGSFLYLPPRPCPVCLMVMRQVDDSDDLLGFMLPA